MNTITPVLFTSLEGVLDTTRQSYCSYPFITEKFREAVSADLVLFGVYLLENAIPNFIFEQYRLYSSSLLLMSVLFELDSRNYSSD